MSVALRKAVSNRARPVCGEIYVPGDKSISHRAIMLSSLSQGTSRISGLLESEDVLATINAFRAMGVEIKKIKDQEYIVNGVGLHGLKKPNDILNMENAGTAMRLIAGILCAQQFDAKLIGDHSLNKRPMGRIIDPLSQMGAKIISTNSGMPPLEILGEQEIKGGYFQPKVASAQIKSAILLAGLWAKESVSVYEPIPTRDYTEKMLRDLGADIEIKDHKDGGVIVKLTPKKPLIAQDIVVPGDISSAAFPLVAAAIVPKSELTIKKVGLHPTRDGIIRSLKEMGAHIELRNQADLRGQQVADIYIRHKPLKAANIPAHWAASQIDEYPILSLAAACAEGESMMNGIGELRVKESDRLAGVAQGLSSCGVILTEGEDWLSINGTGGEIKGGADIKTNLDHRMAMSFLIAGMVSENSVIIDDISPIETSFPNFIDLMNEIGSKIEIRP